MRGSESKAFFPMDDGHNASYAEKRSYSTIGPLTVLSCQNVSYGIQNRQLLENVTFQLAKGEHVGLVGRNGSGKSTLFNLILQNLAPDQAKIECSKGLKLLSVKQEMPEVDLTPLAYLLAQDEESD